MGSSPSKQVFAISVAGIVAIFAAYFLFADNLIERSAHDDTRAKIVAAVANQQRQLPKKINSFTEWTNIDVRDTEISNTYLIDRSKLNIPMSMVIQELTITGKRNAMAQMKQKDATVFFRNGFYFAYRYVDADGKLIHEFMISSSDIPEPSVINP